MAEINYINEHKAYCEWLRFEHLSPSAQSLWNALFAIMNAKGWPVEMIKVPNATLLAYMHVGHDALLDAREQLKRKGLIDYEKGDRRKTAALYRMNYFTLRNLYPEKTDKEPDKEAGKAAGKPADKGADVPKRNYTSTHMYRPPALQSARAWFDPRQPGQPYDDSWRTSEKARWAIAGRLLEWYDGDVDTENTAALLCEAMCLGMRPDLIVSAMNDCRSTGDAEAVIMESLRNMGLYREAGRRKQVAAMRAAGGNQELADALMRVANGA